MFISTKSTFAHYKSHVARSRKKNTRTAYISILVSHAIAHRLLWGTLFVPHKHTNRQNTQTQGWSLDPSPVLNIWVFHASWETSHHQRQAVGVLWIVTRSFFVHHRYGAIDNVFESSSRCVNANRLFPGQCYYYLLSMCTCVDIQVAIENQNRSQLGIYLSFGLEVVIGSWLWDGWKIRTEKFV